MTLIVMIFADKIMIYYNYLRHLRSVFLAFLRGYKDSYFVKYGNPFCTKHS